MALLVLAAAACGDSGRVTEAPDKNGQGAEQTAQTNNGGGASGEEVEADEAAESSTEQAGADTKQVTDDLDRVIEVPLQPQRIVAGEFAVELLELGLKPVGAGNNSFKIPFIEDKMEGIAPIGDPPDAEVILDLQPDLVIVPTVFQEIYPEPMKQIEKIAPVYYVSFEQDPIYGIFVRLAELVGKKDEADRWIAAYEQEAATAQGQVDEALGEETVSIFRVENGRLRIYLNRNFGGYALHSSLQANAPVAVADEIAEQPYGSAIQISLEMLPEYAGDRLLLIVRGEGDDAAAMTDIEELELWKSLPAVQNGQVHKLDTETYYGSDIVTIREGMKAIAAMLTGHSINP
ncbi:ABC transporter substrate-binding protein [Paenibacillus sp. IB182496]|uniref:ABC transporter substrate-binding protein n=2 Tax=Paenibacillus sabuli TaxID=2772509 RepID=A0A927BXE4_9BACL|nr:ABC transporter substrate-binding protein [Paenibacillus sabuli]